MSVTVYVKPSGCQQCTFTKQILNRGIVGYEEVDVTANAEALEFVTDTLGFQQVPVVHLDGLTVKDADGTSLTSWSGLRPDLLIQLVGVA